MTPLELLNLFLGGVQLQLQRLCLLLGHLLVERGQLHRLRELGRLLGHLLLRLQRLPRLVLGFLGCKSIDISGTSPNLFGVKRHFFT